MELANDENIDLVHELAMLLIHESRRIKNNVCTALADKDAKVTKPTVQLTKSIESLQSIAEKDVDGFVRRVAEVNLNLIREWLKEWTATPPELEINIRKEVAPKKKEEIPDEEKEEVRKERSEKNNEYERIQRTANKDVLEY